MSETIKNMLEDLGEEEPIPLPYIQGKYLEKVIEYCTFHTENPEIDDDEERKNLIKQWDALFCKDFCTTDEHRKTLFELLLAANYLDIKPLLNLLCQTVANHIKGQPQEFIKAFFYVDVSNEEEEEKGEEGDQEKSVSEEAQEIVNNVINNVVEEIV